MTRAEVIFAAVSEFGRFIFGMSVLAMNGAVWWWVLTNSTSTSTELTMAIVTTASTFTGVVLGYYFGSSAGSAAKDRTKGTP
jgi:hypothetical protein